MSQQTSLLEKAERYIRSARLMADDGDLDSAASRAYYAMFYVAETLLAALGKSYSSHQGVISTYGREFAKTGKLDPHHHQAFVRAFDRRTKGDYQLVSGLTIVQINEMIADAEAFLAAARAWLAANPPASSP